MNTIFLSPGQRPISYNLHTEHNVVSPQKPLQALFLAGNSITACASMVRLAISKISSRCARMYPAVSAAAKFLLASSHAALAVFRFFAPRASSASSKSCNVVFEQSNSQSNGGMSISVSPKFSCAGSRILFSSRYFASTFLRGELWA